MDIYSQLKSDHDELRRLLEQIGDSGQRAPKKREAAFQDFKLALLVHSKVEEAVFYSQLKYLPELKTPELEAENEHRVAGLLLEELGTMPNDTPEWTAKFMMLRELLEHHIEEEEAELFKKARQALSEELAEDLGTRMRNRSLVVKAALQPVPIQ
ncbi:MAG TPA: hemerythrin domain-containing protein [Gammaproteobacteria bacterium]|nr:hemerythrin domain-containing protein [Gammaproteobacteria bacterium]